MKYKLFLFILMVISVLFIVGCQESSQTQPQETVTGDPNTAQVILLNSDEFPKQLVGIWLNEEHGWIMRIEEDGRLYKLRHTIGRANLIAGQILTFPLVGGGEGIIEPGPWQVQYNGRTNEVIIDIALKHFNYDMVGEGVISGSSRDIFIGTLPDEGETTWTVQWIGHPEYVASTDDKTYTDYQLPFEAGDEDKGEIIFEKYDPEAAQKEAHSH